jgi:hypothetical protein
MDSVSANVTRSSPRISIVYGSSAAEAADLSDRGPLYRPAWQTFDTAGIEPFVPIH